MPARKPAFRGSEILLPALALVSVTQRLAKQARYNSRKLQFPQHFQDPTVLILGIESSCDETGVALYDTSSGLLAQQLFSQVEMHAAYGGVVPELASRDHIQRILPQLDKVFLDSGRQLSNIDAIAVTQGPGLGGALLVGTSVATALGAALGKPVLGVHHLEGHLLSPLLAVPAPSFPFIALLVSGGHTQLMSVGNVGLYTLLGETVDDAAGEAFDKTASLLGLGYPGGPALAKLATLGDPSVYKLPRPMLHSGDLDFSFSGLKTAVLTLTKKLRSSAADLTDQDRANVAAAFEAAIVDVLTTKCVAALKNTGIETLVVAGGVGANQRLRSSLNAAAAKLGFAVFYPPVDLCTDNGAMIAFAGAMRLSAEVGTNLFMQGAFSVRPRWPLSELATTRPA
jgi:N6-L-threonylcarbamoyladenine synthase